VSSKFLSQLWRKTNKTSPPTFSALWPRLLLYPGVAAAAAARYVLSAPRGINGAHFVRRHLSTYTVAPITNSLSAAAAVMATAASLCRAAGITGAAAVQVAAAAAKAAKATAATADQEE
jgi:hypothetical protein